jgi:hypothetical protein
VGIGAIDLIVVFALFWCAFLFNTAKATRQGYREGRGERSNNGK